MATNQTVALADVTAAQESTAQPPVIMQSVGEIVSSESMLVQIDRMADRMASARNTIPKHLAGNPGDCWAVCMQAIQWRMNPFSVAQKTHIVNGALGYEAQLVNAVITSMAPTRDRLNYEWFGDWSNVDGKKSQDATVGVRVFATMKGEDQPRVLELTMAQVGQVRNSPLWTADPRQQLAYLAAKRWARLHCPDVILGVYTADELATIPAERDITPPAARVERASRTDAVKARLQQAGAGEAQEAETAEPEAPAAPQVTLAQVMGWIRQARTEQALQMVGEQIEPFLAAGENEKFRAELHDAYKARLLKLREESEPEAAGDE